MDKELSINADENEINLDNNQSDNAVVALKMAIGMVPLVGSILTEVVGVVIPNQKIDRIKLFVEALAEKVKYIDADVLKIKMKTEQFTDLFEDAAYQASRALTDERREYIANFLKNSLTSDEIDHLGEKKLLGVLNELNDAEIIHLKYKALDHHDEQMAYYETHRDVLEAESPGFGNTMTEYDKLSLWRSYRSKLIDLGLVQPVYKKPGRNEQAEFDEKTGMMKSTYSRLTGLGDLLLSYIDDAHAEERKNKFQQ